MISSKGGCIEIEFSFGSPTFMNEIVVKVSIYIIYEVKIGPGFVGLFILKDIKKKYLKHFAILYESPNLKLHSQYRHISNST